MRWRLRLSGFGEIFFPVSEANIARFIEQTKTKTTEQKTNQNLGLFTAAKSQELEKQDTKTGSSVFTEVCEISLCGTCCERSSPLPATGNERKSEEENLRSFGNILLVILLRH